MTPAEVLDQARATGVTLWGEGDALRYRGPREALAKLLPVLREHKREVLATLAHPDLPGVSPKFASRLSPEDRADIAAGDIPPGTVQAFEQAAVAREAEDLREAFEERAAILEYDAGLPRAEAELEAARQTTTLARNRGYLWASLRAALVDHPELLSQVPDRAGPVDALPLGCPRSPCSGTSA